jgi:MYXO-CTERM domain-containing protein
MRPSRFLPVNTISALVWALAIGLGAYLVGPSITDIVADAGTAGTIAVVALFILTAVVLARRRRRHSARRSDGHGDR